MLSQAATHLTKPIPFLCHTFHHEEPSLVCFRPSYSSWFQRTEVSLSHSQFVVMKQLHISPSCFLPDDTLLLNSTWGSFCPLITVTMQLKENTSWWQLTSRAVEALSGEEKASETFNRYSLPMLSGEEKKIYIYFDGSNKRLLNRLQNEITLTIMAMVDTETAVNSTWKDWLLASSS